MTDPADIARLHASGHQVVLAVTGGGSAAISQLLAVPGASRTLLEAVVPYSEASLAAFLGYTPEQACSPETAASLAQRALVRARALAPDADARLVGLGVTASLASDRPKHGEHRAHLATAGDRGLDLWSVVLAKDARSRADEEALVARAALALLARACGVPAEDPAGVCGPGDRVLHPTHADATPLVRELLDGRHVRVSVLADGERRTDALVPDALLPGSFNPLHEGHLQLAQVAGVRLGARVAFELSVTNVDKPPLQLSEVERRVLQFAGRHALELTRAPTFREKAALFRGATFVVGADTAERIVDPRYYGGDADGLQRALLEIEASGCRFLVAGRLAAVGAFQTLGHLRIPPRFAPLFQALPEDEFRVDLASTTLRREGA